MESIKTRRVGIGIFVVIMLALAVPAGADVREWDGGGAENEWYDPDNWHEDGYDDFDNLTVLSGSPTGLKAHIRADNGGSITLNGSSTVANFSHNLYIAYSTGASGGLEVSNDAKLTNVDGYLGYVSGSTGTATVNGIGSMWTSGNCLSVGEEGTGVLNITDGGLVSNVCGLLGHKSGSSGTAIVSGSGSAWNNVSYLYVGYEGTGWLSIADGGAVSNTIGYIGEKNLSSNVVTVDGAGSTWTNTAELYVGGRGTGVLNIGKDGKGGAVSNTDGFIGYGSTSSGTARVGSASTWTNSGDLSVGYEGTGTLNIHAGGSVSNTVGYLGNQSGSEGTVTVSGTWTNSGILYVGDEGMGTLNITNGGAVLSTHGHLGYNSSGRGTVTVSGAGSTWTNSDSLHVGHEGTGVLNITDGGSVSNTYGFLGCLSGSSGTATVSGAGSTWTNSIWLHVGYVGRGVLDITDGGVVSTVDGHLGFGSSASGTVTVGGAGSVWNNSRHLTVGYDGTGTLTIQTGGEVRVGDELSIGSDGTVNVNGGTIRFSRPDPMASGSEDMNFLYGTLAFDCDMTVTTSGGLLNEIFGTSPTISVLNGLEITGTATLLTPVTLDGGTLSVGDMTNVALLTFNSGRLNMTGSGVTVVGSSGGTFGPSMSIEAGQVLGITDGTVGAGGTLRVRDGGQVQVGALANSGRIVLDGIAAYMGGGTLTNTGTLTGTGQIDSVLANQVAGQVQVGSGEEIVFTASGNTNAGNVEAIGGEVEFTQDLTNAASTGMIVGRNAILRFTGGLTNEGSLAMSTGTSDIFGDITNSGSIVVSGGANATFYDDLANNSVVPVQVSAGCTAVFFGEVSGSGTFDGTGTCYFEGDLKPGSSPGEMTFGGDVVFGSGASLEAELAGDGMGQYDSIDVAGDLALSGTLNVVLINGFDPEMDDTFNLLNWGSLTGEFNTVILPDLAPGLSWDTSDLYSTGGGGITVVPEPATLSLLGLGAVGLLLRRRKSRA